MSSNRDEGIVYYREIQKNAFLKRIPNEHFGNKLLPLGHKKLILKPMWTVFCVHNGRIPYLEQYPEPEAGLTHRPTWRACLKKVRHVTASVKPHIADEYDFLIDTEDGPVRILAPDWDTMQDWVRTLRSKLQELQILGAGQNVYASPPAPLPPRAPARDPTSPLPPLPHPPPQRLPGVEINTTVTRGSTVTEASSAHVEPEDSAESIEASSELTSTRNENFLNHTEDLHNRSDNLPNRTICLPNRTESLTNRLEALIINDNDNLTNDSAVTAHAETAPISSRNIPLDTDQISIRTEDSVDISNWDNPFSSLPSTSQEAKSVAKICGQNICLDDSILKRTDNEAESDNESFKDICRSSNTDSYVNEPVKNKTTADDVKVVRSNEFKQTVVINNQDENQVSCNDGAVERQSEFQGTNVTVIEVSNKAPPHTAIPVLGPERDIVFNFNFKQNVPVKQDEKNFVNIVNTESSRTSLSNGYGTIFSKDESPYGHLSLTTTVNLTGGNNESIYERLCMASTSNDTADNVYLNKIVDNEKVRKSSLPNLNLESAYECLFPSESSRNRKNVADDPRSNHQNVINVLCDENAATTSLVHNPGFNSPKTAFSTSTNITTGVRPNATVQNITVNSSNNVPMNDGNDTTGNDKTNSTGVNNSNKIINNFNHITVNNSSNGTVNNSNNGTVNNSINGTWNNLNNSAMNRTCITTCASQNTRHNSNLVSNRVNLISQNSALSLNLTSLGLRSNVERSHSQNAYDSAPSVRDGFVRRMQNSSPKREKKCDKTDIVQPKPIWRRGLTELSLLSRFRGIGQGKRQQSPTRLDSVDSENRVATTPTKVTHRPRAAARETTRRRSSSLSNGDSPASVAVTPLQTLRHRQASALRAEQARGAAVHASIPLLRDQPLLTEYNGQVWVAWWGSSGASCGGRSGDRVAALRGVAVRDLAHGTRLLQHTHRIDVLFHRVPLGKIYVFNKKDREQIGIKLDSECNIVSVDSNSPAGRAGLPPSGKWAITEVNFRPINLVKGGEDEMNRLCSRGTEVSLLLQPSPLVKKLRAVIKANKNLLSKR